MNNQRKNKSHLIALSLSFMILLSGLILGINIHNNRVNAATTDGSGKVTSTITYKYTASTRTLTISGTGAIPDYMDTTTNSWNTNDIPWNAYSSTTDKIVIGSGITKIGSAAFANMWEQEVSISDTVTEIGQAAFYGNIDLQKFSVSAASTAFTSKDGVLFTKDMKTLMYYPRCKTGVDYVMPSTVTSVQDFLSDNLVNLTFSENLSELTYQQFYRCSSLKNITFPGNAPAMDSSVFDYLYSSNTVVIHYHSKLDIWEALSFKLRDAKGVVWSDLDYTFDDSTKLNVSELSLASGKSSTLSVLNNNNLETTLESDNPAVAMVNTDGTVYGLQSGTATISAKLDGQDTVYKCTVTVTGQTSAGTGHIYKTLSSDDSKTVLNAKKIIPCKEYSGFYYFSNSALYFHSYLTNVSYKMQSYSNVTSYYASDDKFYVLNGYRGCSVSVYDFSIQRLVNSYNFEISDATAVGGDNSGNIYISDATSIYVYSSEGTLLTSCLTTKSEINAFVGFDSTNGNFYVSREYNWVYWGYSHACYAVSAGNYSNGKLTYKKDVMLVGKASSSGKLTSTGDLVINQYDWAWHDASVKVLNNKYLIVNSSLNGVIDVIDSNKTDASDMGYLLLETSNTIRESGEDSDYNIGTGCDYCEKDGYLYKYLGSKKICQYNMSNGKALSTITLKNNLFDMYIEGETLYVIERTDSGVYVEQIPLTSAKNITVSGASTVKAFCGTKLSYTTDSYMKDSVKWSSSNTKIATVDANGKVTAVKPGKVTITAKCVNGGAKATKLITVVNNSAFSNAKTTSYKVSGAGQNNESDNTYSTWSDTVKSYMYQESNGNYVRVYYSDGYMYIERYSKSFKLKSKKSIVMPLELWGGFYHTSKYNYVVIGQENPKEKDNVEVYRIIKYNQKFKQVGVCSVDGANTYIPFDAGSCRMTECGGKLYVYTCHEMYAAKSDKSKTHHQANVTLVIKESSMKLVDSYYSIADNEFGYVSHSFNQFIATDGKYIYRADHGDACPRGLYLSKISKNSDVTNPSQYGTVYSIAGDTGDNSTGVSLGGFSLTTNGPLYAYNSVNMNANKYDSSGNRNIFISLVDKTTGAITQKKITKYTKSQNITVGTPMLVKINDNIHILMWEESSTSKAHQGTKCVAISDSGEVVSDIKTVKMDLSDCQPFVTKNNMIAWYVSDGSTVKMNLLNPKEIINGSSSTIKVKNVNKKKSSKK